MDPQQQQHLAGLMASMGMAILFVWLIIIAFLVFLFWRIFARAGMAGPLSLLVLIPGIGWLIALCILAFGEWKVAPVPPGYAVSQTAYPPSPYPASPSAYPPASPTNYPPAGPPTQL